MKKASILFSILLFATILIVSCSRTGQINSETEQLPRTVEIYLYPSLNGYKAVSALENVSLRKTIENELNITIHLNYLDSLADSFSVVSSGFNGLLLTDNPSYTVRLGTGQLVSRLNQKVKTKNYGSNQGYQYGYVFSQSSTRTPVMIINKEAFESANIKNIPYSFKDLKEALTELHVKYTYPLALCGNPIDANYCLIQTMFDVCPSGGHEFSMSEDGTLDYDKISGNGYAYLEALRTLFQESLIPNDMLILNEYSLMQMLLNKISACAVFTDIKIASETIKRMMDLGMKPSIVNISSDISQIEFGLDSQLLGFVSSSFDDTELAVKIFEMLDKLSSSVKENFSFDNVEEYDLFQKKVSYSNNKVSDFDKNLYAMLISYKTELDSRLIEPYYARIASGDYSISLFYEMKSLWEDSEILTDYDYISGKTILRIFNQVFNINNRI